MRMMIKNKKIDEEKKKREKRENGKGKRKSFLGFL